MLGLLCSICAAIATCVKMLTCIVKYIIHKNYEFVAMVIEIVAHFVTSVSYMYSQFKQLIITVATCTVDFFVEVHLLLSTFVAELYKFIICIYKFLQICYANVTEVCLSCVNYISTCFLTLSKAYVVIRDILAMSADISVSLIVTAVSTFFVAVTTLGSCCISFVTGVWQGLGFVLSSVASFPTYCVQSVKNIWIKTVESVTSVVTITTKETYLGIIVLCLLYLTLSNTLRYLYSRGLSLFPRRIRNRRARANTAHWQFDRGFESDYEDLYNSDTENVSWVTPTQAENDDTDESDDIAEDDINDHDSNNSENISDADDDSDSEEYTVVTEESDSEASINSQAYSTESSDHEIEVLLPPVDMCYSLCSRSSTPSRVSKTVSSPEDFDREMERERDKRKCVVCQDQIKSVLVLPCKHMCMCVLCADQIVRSRTIGRRVCPLCRTRIAKVMNIYV